MAVPMRKDDPEELPICEDCDAEVLDCTCTLWRGRCPTCGVVQIRQTRKPTRCLNRRWVDRKMAVCGQKLTAVFCIWTRPVT